MAKAQPGETGAGNTLMALPGVTFWIQGLLLAVLVSLPGWILTQVLCNAACMASRTFGDSGSSFALAATWFFAVLGLLAGIWWFWRGSRELGTWDGVLLPELARPLMTLCGRLVSALSIALAVISISEVVTSVRFTPLLAFQTTRMPLLLGVLGSLWLVWPKEGRSGE